MKLTPKQQHFVDLLTAGVNNSEAYREAYDTQHMAPATIHREAHALANHPKITTALDAARAITRHDLRVHANDLIKKLEVIAYAPLEGPVRNRDKIAALHIMAKIAGLYRDGRKDHDNHPHNVTYVTAYR